MSGNRYPALIGGVLVGMLMVSAAALHPAAAAQLHVTAAPIQTWKVTDLPGLPDAPVDLTGCGDLDQYDEIVYGTAADDELIAGNGRQILVGLAGDDTLIAANHDDCLIGGPGNDRLLGGNGRDLLFGQDGADHLDGGTGKDLLDAGGDPGDTCSSEGAPDVLVGCDAAQETLDDATTQSTPDQEENDSADTDGEVPEPEQVTPQDPVDEPTEEPTDEQAEEPVDEPADEPVDPAPPTQPSPDPATDPLPAEGDASAP